MRRRGTTLEELRWPEEIPEFEAAAKELIVGAIRAMLEAVWNGYDEMTVEVLAHIDIRLADAQLELELTKHLYLSIQRHWNSFKTLEFVHSWPESATRIGANTSPPIYDLAFLLRGNPRSVWPLEAKVLRQPTDISEYVRDLRNEFLTCRYAPFSSGGAMVGYLIEGEPSACLAAIQRRLRTPLEPFELNTVRPHRQSMHTRVSGPGLSSPLRFSCHHLVMKVGPVTAAPPVGQEPHDVARGHNPAARPNPGD